MKAIFKSHKIMKTIVVFAVLIVAAMFIMESFTGSFNDLNAASQTQATTISPAVSPSVSTIPSSNGTYTQAEVGNINHLNLYSASTVCDFMLLDEIYDSPYNFMPNETYAPWLATGYNITNAPANMTTVDPITGNVMPVSEIATVQIRPGVQWNDWTSSNAGSTYSYSPNTTFVTSSGVPVTATYKNVTYESTNGTLATQNISTIQMRTYYVQSSDFILSWKLLHASADFSGEYQYLVNMLPVNNLTVVYYLSQPNALFESTMLATSILPYHIWASHAYASTPGLWNYSATLPASGAYNVWTLGYNPTTGYAPGLVGTGPYMMYNGYGMPKGAWISSDYWQLYANPNYFVKNVPGLAQYMPKLYSIKTIIYSTYSAAVAAESSGQVQSILSVPSTFLPTIQTIPNTYTYDKPGTGYGYQQINSYSANAPFNITGLRQALEYAIPKTYLATVVAEGFSIPGPSTVIPPSDSVWHDSSVPYYHFSLAKAESTINATINATNGALSYSSGGGHHYFSPGKTLYYNGVAVTQSIQITVASEDPLGVEGANIIASDWDALGIHTSVKEESFSTLVANLCDLTPSSPTTYSAISLGISGIVGNPAADYITFNNNVYGVGTGFYLGPYTSFTYTGPTLHLNSTQTGNLTLTSGDKFTGTQTINMMDNLTNYMLTNSSLAGEQTASDMIQMIQGDQATFENLGYSIDIIPITNATFTGIQKTTLPIDSFWYWNFFSLHERKVPLVTKAPVVTQHLEVGVVSNSHIYYNGQYGNVTIQVRNQYGTPINNATVTIGYTPSGALLNVTSYTGVTSGNGTYRFEFQVSSLNSLIYTSDYTGEINLSASATDTSINAVGGLGSTQFDVSPYPVAYRVVSMPALNMKDSSKFQNMTVEVYNPLTGHPISGYSYTVQVNSGALNMTNVTGNLSTLAGNPGAELYSPVNFGNQTLGNVSLTGYSDATFTPNGTFAVVLDNTTGMIGLVNLTLNTTTSLLPSDLHVGRKFKVGSNPDAVQVVQVNPNNATSVWAFVANYGSHNVTAVNLSSGVTHSYTVGADPVSIQLALNGANNSFAYVLNRGSSNITVLNMTNMSHVFSGANLSLGSSLEASDMQFAESGGYMLVSDTAKNQIEVVNLTNATGNMWSVVGNMSLGSGTAPTNISESGGMLYVQDSGLNNVSVISLEQIGFNPYLNMAGYNYYSHALVANISIGKPIKSMALADGFLLVTNTANSNVTAIATTDVAGYKTANTIVDNLTTMGSGSDITVMGSMALTTSSNELTMISGANSVISPQYNMEQVQGTTGSNGEFTIGLQMVGNSTADYGLMGMNLTSYVFLGDYQAGAPVFGEEPYMDIAQLTSATNPNGFGVAQPVEIPVQTTMAPPQYNIAVSLSSGTISSPTGTDTVTVTVTNANGAAVSGYAVSLVSQNALGANRGYFTNVSGSVTGQIAVPDLNSLFGSVNLTGIQLVTNSDGKASATFYAGMYGVISKADGSLDKYVSQSFTDPYYVPADVFQLSAYGQNGTASNVSTVYSKSMENNPAPSTMISFYVPPSQNVQVNGFTAVGSGKSFSLYVNSTYDLAAGPGEANVSFTATVNHGTLTVTNGTTNANGSFMLTYTAPTVSNLTLVTLTVTTNGSGQNFTYFFYVAPSQTHVTAPPSPVMDYVIMGILAAIAVIFIGLFAMEAAKVRKLSSKTPPSPPPTQ